MSMLPITTPEEFRRMALDWRGIDNPCKGCGGSGVRVYGSTSTWRGGIGGQAMTHGVCDTCWGSGETNPWVNLKKLEAHISGLYSILKSSGIPFRNMTGGCGRCLHSWHEAVCGMEHSFRDRPACKCDNGTTMATPRAYKRLSRALLKKGKTK